MHLTLFSTHLRSPLLLLLSILALERATEVNGSEVKGKNDPIDWTGLIPSNDVSNLTRNLDFQVKNEDEIVFIQSVSLEEPEDISQPSEESQPKKASQPRKSSQPTDASQWRDTLQLRDVSDASLWQDTLHVGSPSQLKTAVQPRYTSMQKEASLPRDTSEKKIANYSYSPFREMAASFRLMNSDDYFLNLLLALMQQEFVDCDLVLGHGEVGGADLEIIRMLSSYPIEKQTLLIKSVSDFSSISWRSSKCRGYLFLWVDSDLLSNFTNHNLDLWDYRGRFIFAGLSKESLELLVQSEKGRKTEHVLGLLKYRDEGHWGLYANKLFWGTGLQKVGNWYRNKFSSAVEVFPDKTSDLRGIPLKAVIFLWEPSVMFREETGDEGTYLDPYGMDVELINTLGRVMNFSITFLQPPEGERWGEVHEDGTITGLVGMVNRGEAEMGSTNIFVSVTRLGIIDFSKDYDMESSCLLVKTEPPLPKWQSLGLPFQLWTWLSFFIGLLVLGPLLALIAKGSKESLGKDKLFNLLSYSWLYTTAMHLRAGSLRYPVQTSIQIYVAFVSIYCFIVTIAYSTNLTAFLTVERPPTGMETIKELPGSGVFVIGVDTYYKGMLISSPDPNLQIMAGSYQVHHDFKDVFRLVQEGKGVFIDNHGYLEYTILTKFTKQGVASLRIMKECLSSHPVAMALQRHSPLKRTINKTINRLLSGGLIRRFFLNAIRLAASEKASNAIEEDGLTSTDKKGGSNLVPLSLNHLQGLFFICAIGWLVSIGVFLVESMSSASLSEKRGKGLL